MRTTLFLILACMMIAPVAAAEDPLAPYPDPTDQTEGDDCIFVDTTRSPPRVYTAPC